MKFELSSSASTPISRNWRILWRVFISIFIIERLIFTFYAPPVGDEAYYWMWGQKLDLSYFDHPPLHAWLLHLSSLVFGWNLFALRVLTWMSLIGSVLIFRAWSRRLSPDHPEAWFWPCLIVYLASPMFSMMTVIAFHDHLMVFLCLLTAYCFLNFADRYAQNETGFIWLYAAAIALGLGILAKYNAALFGAGGALFILLQRNFRAVLKSWHLWISALIVIMLQTPVLLWNYQQRFASFRFHLEDRWEARSGINWIGIPNFILTAILVVSPFLVPALIGMIKRRSPQRWSEHVRILTLCTLMTSSAVMLYFSFYGDTNFYWNIAAFILFVPMSVGWIKSPRLISMHAVYGLAITTALLVNNCLIPLQNLAGRYDWTVSSGFGWPHVADRIETIRHQQPVDFIATTFYSTAAQLGFVTHDPDVVALSGRHDQYDYWFNPELHQGQNALVLSDKKHDIKDLQSSFDRLELIEKVPYVSFGFTVYETSIYLGVNFHGANAR